MKKNNIALLAVTLLLALPTWVHAQWYSNLNVNNVKILVRSDGILFFDGVDGEFIAPYEEGAPENSTMKTAGLWLAGKVAGTDSLRGAIQLYNEDGKSDFVPGTLDANSGAPSGQLTKIYRATKSEIMALIEDFEDGGVSNTPTLNLLGWPGDNNPHFYDTRGEELPPALFGYKNFYDRDQDGVYDPYHGDHPAVVIRGCDSEPIIPDEMLWFTFNDNVVHTESGMEPIRMEVQCMVYAFNCQESPLGNSVFVRYRLNNRASTDLDSVRVGLFADFDIGNPDDDFFGTDFDQAMIFGYNGDEEDEDFYGENAPAMSIDLLRGPLDSELNELGIASVIPFADSQLVAPENFFNILSGKLADGTPAPNGGVFYDGNPNNANEWSEVSDGNIPGNRKVVVSYEPFSLLQGAVNELIVGFTFYQEEGNSPLENVEAMYEQSPQVQELFDNCFYSPALEECTPLPSAIFERPTLEGMKIFPNPASHQVTIEDLTIGTDQITISSFDGKQIFSQKTETGQSQVTLDLGDLPTGIYLLEGWKDEMKIAREKLALMKN